MQPINSIADLAELCASYYDDPLGFVIFMFPWNTDASIQNVPLPKEYNDRFPGVKHGPDKWACEYLDRLGQEIKARKFDGTRGVSPLQMSTSSGHGIGKSALVAWLILFIMCTRPYCRITVTATTETQLRARTWAELGKWFRRSVIRDVFVYNTGRGAMNFYHPDQKTEWFAQGITCKEENSVAFSGQHAANSSSVYIFDEASGVPDEIWRVRGGGLTDGEPMTFDFGNPTKNSGYFYDNMEGQFKANYIKFVIDSRDVHLPTKSYLESMIKDYGIDSDYIKVRIRGMFPSIGSFQFMPTDDVLKCMTCMDMEIDKAAPLVIGVDAARYGDDETVIFPRLGRDARTFAPKRMSNPNVITIAIEIGNMIEKFRSMGLEYSEVFVDSTGGYGGGIADNFRALGYHCIEIGFGKKSPDPKYRFMSDYMWGKLRDDISSGLCLPKAGGGIGETALVNQEDIEADDGLIANDLSRDLFKQLTGRQFSYTIAGDKIHLEPKKDMKTRMCSPDLVDALAVTYAMPVKTRAFRGSKSRGDFTQFEYDPYDNIES